MTAAKTTTYVLTVVAADGTTTLQQIILNVEESRLWLRYFGSKFSARMVGGPDDVQFRLCYEVRNAEHAEIDNEAAPWSLIGLTASQSSRSSPRHTLYRPLDLTAKSHSASYRRHH